MMLLSSHFKIVHKTLQQIVTFKLQVGSFFSPEPFASMSLYIMKKVHITTQKVTIHNL